MFAINEDLSIHLTRGDTVFFSVTGVSDGKEYTFQPNDIIRFKVTTKKNCEDVVLQKDFIVETESGRVDILLTGNDTKIGGVISKPTDFWYEVELNPLTNPQTIIGYDEDGAKVFKLYPEGSDSFDETKEEDVPVVDDDFSLSSSRPLENQVITRRFKTLEETVEKNAKKLTSKDIVPITKAEYEELVALGTWQEDTIYIISDSSGQSEVDAEALETANRALATAETALRQTATVETYIVNVPNSEWVEDSTNGGYMCNVAVNNILETDNPISDVILGENISENTLLLTAWGLITRIVTGDNSITIYANKSPEKDFTIQLKVVR